MITLKNNNWIASSRIKVHSHIHQWLQSNSSNRHVLCAPNNISMPRIINNKWNITSRFVAIFGVHVIATAHVIAFFRIPSPAQSPVQVIVLPFCKPVSQSCHRLLILLPMQVLPKMQLLLVSVQVIYFKTWWMHIHIWLLFVTDLEDTVIIKIFQNMRTNKWNKLWFPHSTPAWQEHTQVLKYIRCHGFEMSWVWDFKSTQ